MDNQFYPTPAHLARYAFNLFDNKSVVRLLEGSAGRGDMLDAIKDENRHVRPPEVDCVEIDFENQAVLKGKGYKVVGFDFLEYRGGPAYSHILINPPFNQGADHALHAWNLLVDGELVAILNAETIRNPCTSQRKLLVKLVNQYGDVEFHQAAFAVGEAKRKTDVEVAIIHLTKKSDFDTAFLGQLERDHADRRDSENLVEPPQELMIGSQFIKNQVKAFDLAVEAQRLLYREKARAGYYMGMLGRSILDDTTDQPCGMTARQAADKEYNAAYMEIKERAWSSILRSSMVLDKLGSESQKRVESSFADITSLAFTTQNIYGFLEGLIAQQGSLQTEMCCDVFDAFGKYREGNMFHYCGWKSNTKHRLNAFKLKHTRVILPACRYGWYSDGWYSSLSWEDNQRFRDFDKVFAMLDGKNVESVNGLCDLFDGSGNLKEMASGDRMASDYFEVRFYPGAGTFHLYPRRKDLIERLNRVVGKYRAWLPDESTDTAPGFWEQYDKAEKLAKHIDWRGIDFWKLEHGSEYQKEEMGTKLIERYKTALDKVGIEFDPESAIEHVEGAALPSPDMEAAA